MINLAKTMWQSAVNWFEHGDLIPLMVLVSAVHYASVLRGHDGVLAAVAIGLLVDLGHYRTVRYAVRYTGVRRWEIAVRWGIAFVMTAVSFVYHFRYYNDWLLAAPLPFLIAVLAWLESRNRSHPAKPSETERREHVAIATVSESERTTAKTYVAICQECEWQHNGYKSQSAATNALNAHMRRHVEKIVVDSSGDL